MPAAVAVPAAISAGTSIFGGLMGSRGAKTAAQQQAAAAEKARQQLWDASGGAGANLDAAAADARAKITDASGAAANNVQDAANLAQNNVWDQAAAAKAGMSQAVGDSNSTLKGVYDKALSVTDPYTTAGSKAVGTLSSYLDPNGEFNQKFQFSQDDPGYQFRLQEGQKALQRSKAAQGAVRGGGVLKALSRYGQGMASQEYQNAFDRFQSDRAQRFGMLSDLAKTGQTSAAQAIGAGNAYGAGVSNNNMAGAEYSGNVGNRAAEAAGTFGTRGAQAAGDYRVGGANIAGQIGTDAAKTAGNWTMGAAGGAADLITGAGNAQAAGTVGSANAWNGALSGVGNAAASAISGYQANKKKPLGLSGLLKKA